MPRPIAGESHDDWMHRCMHRLKEEGKEHEQSVAICMHIWDERGKGEDMDLSMKDDRKAGYSIADVRDVTSYERYYQQWMDQLSKVQSGVAAYINDFANVVDTLLSDQEANQDWERITEMQALLSRMYSENEGLPGLKSLPYRLVAKGAHGVYR